jgi:hypothetical protein
MARYVQTLASTAATALALLSCHGITTTSAACAPADAAPAPLIATSVLEPPFPSGGECIYTSDPTAPTLSHGTVDCALTQTYAPTLLVGNDGPQTEIQGAVVEVIDPATSAVITNGSVLGSASVFAASGTQPSFTTVALTLMNAAAVSHFCPGPTGTAAKTAEVVVSVYGQELGGRAAESNELVFSVDVCYGCLVSAPPNVPAGYCSGAFASESSSAACVLGQDQTSDCQLCEQIAYCKNLK